MELRVSPGIQKILEGVIERQLEIIRKDWIRGVRKVVAAPPGSQVVVASGEIKESDSPSATPIRIVDDPKAPAYRKVDFDVSHPFRMTELLRTLNKKMAGKLTLNLHDIYCLRRLHDWDTNPVFCNKPLFTSMQYSEALVQYIMKAFAQEPDFFMKAKKECHARRYELKLVARPKGKKR
jgi:EC042_2821-lke REase